MSAISRQHCRRPTLGKSLSDRGTRRCDYGHIQIVRQPALRESLSAAYAATASTSTGLASKKRFSFKNGFSRRFHDNVASAKVTAVVIGKARYACLSI